MFHFDWGTRFNGESFSFSQEAFKKDKESNRCREELTYTKVLAAHNNLNPTLVFTGEREDDFQDNHIPTLDFKIRKKDRNQFSYTFFEKGVETK